MLPEDFLYWLEGFFVLREAEGKPPQGLTAYQVERIKAHIKMVNITLDEGDNESDNENNYGKDRFPLYQGTGSKASSL